MPELVMFVPKATLEAKRNLEEFVRLCRHDLTVFGADLPFDSPAWNITGYIDKKADNSRTSVVFEKIPRNRPRFRVFSNLLSHLETHPECCLDEGFGTTAKAIFRYLHAHKPRKDFYARVNALRCLEASLRECTPDRSPVDPTTLTHACMNRSLALAKDNFKPSTASVIGSELEYLARFINDHGLVRAAFRWRNSLYRESLGNYVGQEADQERENKLPSQAALDAMGSIFQRATEPRDVVTTSVAGILLSGASRIHELLLSPANLEVYQGVKEGKQAYGLRWENGKGDGPQTKWLSTPMAAVAQIAIGRIRKMTEPARRIAKWYESNPTKMYLPHSLEHLRYREKLSRHEIAAILGLEDHNSICRILDRHGIHFTDGSISFNTLELVVLKMLPRGFPWLNEGLGIRYSDALFVVQRHLLHAKNGTSLVMIQAINRAQVQKDLSDVNNIFVRHRSLDEDGNQISMTSHQARHFLLTTALVGGMSRLDASKWAGLKEVKTVEQYNDRSPEQVLKLIRESVGNSDKIIGPLSSVPQKIPITKAEFARQTIPNVQVTILGWCVHAYPENPCELFDDCINCHEHVFIKGEYQKNQAARELYQIELKQLQKAADAKTDEYGAERWEEHHGVTADRYAELVALYDDPQIPKDTVIQLAYPREAPMPSLDKEGHEQEVHKKAQGAGKKLGRGTD